MLNEHLRSTFKAQGEDQNTLVINLMEDKEGEYYTVTTAVRYAPGRKLPGEVIWDGSVDRQRDSGDPARIPYRNPQEAGEDAALRNSGQTTPPIPTIPAEDGNVNWTNEALDNLLRQSGVTEEQAQDFRSYAQSLIDQGGDLSDAGTLGRELQTAIYSAEGLEQAAAGLERIIADPAKITDAIFRAMNLEVSSFQEGIAEIQRRITDLNRRAQQFRSFYRDPAMMEEVRRVERLAQSQGDRALVSMTPDINTNPISASSTAIFASEASIPPPMPELIQKTEVAVGYGSGFDYDLLFNPEQASAFESDAKVSLKPEPRRQNDVEVFLDSVAKYDSDPLLEPITSREVFPDSPIPQFAHPDPTTMVTPGSMFASVPIIEPAQESVDEPVYGKPATVETDSKPGAPADLTQLPFVAENIRLNVAS